MAASSLKHIRLKREAQTIFMFVEPGDSFQKVKARLAQLLEMPVTQLRLIHPDKVTPLADGGLFSDHPDDIPDDATIFFVFSTGDGDDDWEDPVVAEYTDDAVDGAQ